MRRYSYIDPMTYSWGGLMNNQFRGRPAYLNGEHVLHFYGHATFLDGDKWKYLGVLQTFFWIFMVLSYLGLKYKRIQAR